MMAVLSGIVAGSVSLIGFGVDFGIEVSAAAHMWSSHVELACSAMFKTRWYASLRCPLGCGVPRHVWRTTSCG